MVALTREQRRRRVLELHNQGMGTREIAGILHMSFTDIGKILKDADKEKEDEQQRTRQELLSSQAYKLFSAGKSPVQVAFDLTITEAIVFQREYWELLGLNNLNQIYEEIKDDTWYLVNLYRSVKAESMDAPHVLRLLKVANKDLPSIESRYEMLKQEVNSLKEQKRNLYNQVTTECSNLEYYRVACQREIANFEDLQLRKRKAEALAVQFENNNPQYVNIRKTVKKKSLPPYPTERHFFA